MPSSHASKNVLCHSEAPARPIACENKQSNAKSFRRRQLQAFEKVVQVGHSLSGKGSVSVELELPALALLGTIGSAWTHVSQQDLQQQPGPGALLSLLLLETGSSKPKAVRAWPPPGPHHSVQDLLLCWPPE
ncbi:unnamed protein product [Rangifer tarandus platyrhynchus]|uniref:Uncharacterized protein n=2 Tax=Rangifer tarandus platyrhynchus TaxID=3082113 RepID=A0AC59YY33_RANTA|nr:unnamed protein product [Rangifer tarandus platyrhynchus]